MLTRFVEGQKVRATVKAQGMEKGEIFEVVGIEIRMTPFGGFTTYFLRNERHPDFAVGNGHLLLTEVES